MLDYVSERRKDIERKERERYRNQREKEIEERGDNRISYAEYIEIKHRADAGDEEARKMLIHHENNRLLGNKKSGCYRKNPEKVQYPKLYFRELRSRM